ncbi:MAG: T9SS type A sorting domain-containing protein, partial [Bacteroidota bacterium]
SWRFVVDSGNGYTQIVSLRCIGNNTYVSSENGNGPMNCNRNSVGSWEKFEWAVSGNTVSLKNSGAYVSSENGNGPMRCNRSSVGAWEKFVIEHKGNQVYAFKCSNGKYMSGGSPMRCNANAVGDMQKFKVSWGLSARISQQEQVSVPTLPNTEIKFSIYPNPISSGEHVYMNWSPVEEATIITAFDSMGRKVYEKTTKENNLTIPSETFQHKGLYFISTSVDGRMLKVLVK